jgi:hypothetical protein
MPLSEAVCYISIFYFISTPIYVYKEWDILIKISQKISAILFYRCCCWNCCLDVRQTANSQKALGIFIILFVLNSLKSIKHFTKIKFIWFYGWVFSDYLQPAVLYVIIIQNEANDIKTFRATMFASLGLVTVMRSYFSIWGFCHGANFTILYMFAFFLYSYFLGKSVFKIR